MVPFNKLIIYIEEYFFYCIRLLIVNSILGKVVITTGNMSRIFHAHARPVPFYKTRVNVFSIILWFLLNINSFKTQ